MSQNQNFYFFNVPSSHLFPLLTLKMPRQFLYLQTIHVLNKRKRLKTLKENIVLGIYLALSQYFPYWKKQPKYSSYSSNLQFTLCTPQTCQCKESKFCYEPHGHVITGDLRVIENAKLRELVAKEPKYREPNRVNWKATETMFLESINLYAKNWSKREQIELKYISLGTFKAWRFLKGTKTNNATVWLHLSKILSESKAAHLFWPFWVPLEIFRVLVRL